MRQYSISGYIKPLLFFAVLFGWVFWLKFHPSTLKEWFNISGYAVIVANMFCFLYDAWLWKFNPLERMPRLARDYSGTLVYKENGESCQKPIHVSIVQRRLSVSVTTETDKMTSRALASSLVEEEGGISLYYVYRTTPKAAMENDNPVQTGTCRIFLESVPVSCSKAWVWPKVPKKISAKYWTSRGTVGDIYLEECAA